MIVSPTVIELQSEALQIIEQATADHFLEHSSIVATSEQQPEKTVKAVEAVIQVAEFQAELSATRIKFFALATYIVDFATEPTEGSAFECSCRASRFDQDNM